MVGVIAGLGDQLDIGERFEQFCGELGALADRNDRLRAFEGLNQFFFGREFFGEDLNFGPLPEARDRGRAFKGALVIVEDGDFHEQIPKKESSLPRKRESR